MDTDFSTVTPCGGNCGDCKHFGAECEGCFANGGKCVHMWENGCRVFRCCDEHNVRFCGLCGEFPCDYVKDNLPKWDKDAIGRLERLGAEYRKRETEFSEKLPALWEKIGTHGVMVLSTCADGRVTSRPMSVAVIGGKFYCQTDENFLKYKQLMQNGNAALCVKNFSVEGKCRSIGKPFDNSFFISAMRENFPNAVERWSSLTSERVLEITPTLIYSWDYEDNMPYMEYWNFDDLTYKKECKQ
ncbi:MAG: DUF3795 domain-containing protein [Oscillospiraceae bacterium]|nr:DUF3795 domain-containing protein [Oscillospiraceae bacterium]